MPRRRSASSAQARLVSTVIAVVVLALVTLVVRGPSLFGDHDDAGTGAEQGGGTATVRPLPRDLSAQDALNAVPTKGKAPQTGYSRKEFGEAWADVDHNGCDTRNDVLARDMTEEKLRAGTCKISTGVLHDPYTGRDIHFTAGAKTSEAVQIDHVVALSNAWQTGAQNLAKADRQALANDPLNLLAVDGKTNNGKSDGDAATWLPPNKGFRCEYVARQAGVKDKYGLWVTASERDAMQKVLDGCPGQKVPAA